MRKFRTHRGNKVDTLYLDGMNMAFRMIFNRSGLKSNNKDSSVVYGSLMAIKSLIEKFRPKNVLFVLEGKHSRSRRKEIYPEYKAHRKTNLPISKEEFYGQVSNLEDLLYNLGVSVVKVNTYEADDTIAVLSKANKNTSIIVSTDGDYLQCINGNISVYNPTKEILINTDNFKETVGVELIDFLDWKCMVGDSSDNIKGVVGIGDVTAKAICNFMGYNLTLEAGEKNVDKKFKKIFTEEGKEQFQLAKKLIDLSLTELTINEAENAIIKGVYDSDEVKDLLEDIDAWSLLDNYSSIHFIFSTLDNERKMC